MPLQYEALSEEERKHFVEHGWLHVKDAIDPKYLTEWMKDFWVRLGWDEHDHSTWQQEYLKMPRHREARCEDFCRPEAWQKMLEIIGGEDKIDPVRERYYGDQFICNFGGDELWGPREQTYQTQKGWHTDNDWYRFFLDSSGNALTIIFLFTDVLPRGGGTVVCEDGITGICQTLYDHPEGLDPPYKEANIYAHIPKCKKFTQIEGKAGDVFITHGMLPHAHTPNHLPYARVITNPHVNMNQPFNLNRPDGDYTLCEQVILRALNRESIPEYKPTRERQAIYPRTAYFKRERVPEELRRMIADAERRGLTKDDVDSVYLKGEEALKEHERRNGYDKPFGVNGVCYTATDDRPQFIPEEEQLRHLIPPEIVLKA